MQTVNRAGTYQKQSTGYNAFIPAPLPPEIEIDMEMQTLLSRADRALGRLDGSIQTLPNHDLFVLMYVRKEAVLSSQIEGTQSSLSDVLEAEANIHSSHRPNDAIEVINYVGSLRYGISRLKELPISIRLIKEIHEKLLSNVRGQEKNPGELRTSQNWIGSGGCSLRDATFIPPPPHELMEHLGNLEKFIHGDDDIPFLIKIALIHSQFETIHPFLDGNGRVGRLLITFLMYEKEILCKPVLYLSHYFKRHQSKYYQLLQDVRDEGKWEEWIKFFLRGVAEVSAEATETARKIVDLREENRDIIQKNFGKTAGNALILLERLFYSPYVDIKIVAENLNISYPTANNLVNKFVEYGILHEQTGQQRYRLFFYKPYVSLFQ
ncbi:Fic family protein [Komagataeibacter xylinus]|uniref:Fic family protein n=1 Tax=Komagataeibacter xylinus TaxID=28448 RepID=UPI00280B5654|nr:Fic family protein [Komagataeibacter xylinus]